MISQIDFNGIRSQAGLSGSDISVGELISKILPFLVAIAGIYFLFQIISAGFMLLTAAGEPKKAAAARATITSSLLGLLLVASSYTILLIIGNILGIGGFNGLLN